MKKVDLTVTKQNNVDTIKYDLVVADVYDDRAADKATQLSNIIPLEYSDVDGKRTITSYAHEDTNLSTLYKSTLTKKEVFCVMSGLVSVFEIGAQGIPVSYIVKDSDYIYIDKTTYAVKCVLVPIKQDVMPLAEIPAFFREVVSNMRFSEEDKDNYVATMLTLINSDDFSVAKLKEHIDGELEKMGLFISKDNGLTNMSAGGDAAPQKSIKVNKIGVMANMQNSMNQAQQMAPMGQPMMGQPQQMAPMGQPMMGQPQQMAPMGQPMMGQPQPAPQMPQAPAPQAPKPAMPNMPGMAPQQNQPMMGQPQPAPQMPQAPAPQATAPQAPKPAMPNMPGMAPQQNQPMMGQPQLAPQMPQAPAPQATAPQAPKPAMPNMPGMAPQQNQLVMGQPQPAPQMPQAPKPAMPNMPGMAPQQNQPVMGQPQPAPQMPQAPKPAMSQAPAPQVPQPVAPEEKSPVSPSPVEPKPVMPPMGQIMPNSVKPFENAPAQMTQNGLVGQLGSKPIPHIVRKKTGEVINITKSEFAIGKSKTKADYAIEDNTAISRVHCIIVQKDGVNYIKDNNSTNHTYINGVELQPGKEVLLKNKTLIQLGDEEFTFLLRKGE